MDKKKLVILSRSFASSSKEPFEYLEKNGIEYEHKPNNEPENTERIAEWIGDADAVIVGADVIDRYVLDKCPRLKAVQKHGVGMDAIDMALCEERGIKVGATPGANNDSVADLTVLLMMAVCRNLKGNTLNDPSPSWKTGPLTKELYKAKVGLVGYGRIGHGVALRLTGFSCEIFVYDPFMKPENITTPNTHLCELDEVLANADIVSIHAPLNESTKNMIDASAFAKMKDGVFIVNTSRGGLMDYRALYDALKSGKVAGAGLDVFPEEPPKDEPLITLPNVVATPHIATHTKESNYRMGMMCAENVVSFLK